MAAAKTTKAAANKAKTTRKTSAQKAAAGKKSAAKSAKSARSAKSEKAATVDHRSGGDRREASDRREKDVPVPVERRKIERRVKVNRRRQIDPTTCERDYSSDELEFMSALDDYKRTSGRMFPTCSEILEVLKKLGYERRPAGEPVEPPAPPTESEPADAGSQLQQEQEAAV